ncbi:MAG TPA: ABC transporter permease [Gemmatimonadaceae bacterium]|jgi:predicted permease
MADFRMPPLNGGERFYRALLHLYPARFRRAFKQDLIETFRDERRSAAQLGVSATAFWLAAVNDVITQGAAERMASVARLVRRGDHDEDTLMSALSGSLRLAELRVAFRRLRRAPSFALTTVVVLALGVGATTAVFSVVNGVLLRPLPYRQPDRLVEITHTVQVAGLTTVDQSDAGLLYYQRHATAFEGSAGWRDRDVNVSPPADDPGPASRVSAAMVTANLFDVFGIAPELGRDFHAGEDRINAPPVAMLSHRLWTRLFRGDPSVVGKRILIDGVSREIVGVMPRDFVFIHSAPEIWYPVPLDAATAAVTSFNYSSVARLRAGETPVTARADLVRILPHILEEFASGIPPAMWAAARVEPVVTPLRDYLVGDASRLLWILLGSVSLVLVIACANVASLFLVRGESRQHELAVRGALGSGTAGMMTQPLSESIVLAFAGGALGVLLAEIGVRFARVSGGELGLPRLEEVSVDARVLLFALGVSFFCAVVVSLVPVLRARRIPVAIVLREAGRGGMAGAARQRLRSALVVAQVALALILVAASGLLARSFARLRDVRPGFDPNGVIMARIVLPQASYKSYASVILFENQLLERLRALPGVRSASLSDLVPLTPDANTNVVSVEDHPVPLNAVPRVHTTLVIDGGYFRTMKIPLLAGRTFSQADPARPSSEAIVSHAFAERYWPNGSPLGKRLRPAISGAWLTIVGEVGDVHYDALDKPASEAAYYPLALPDSGMAGTPRYVALFVDARGHEATVASTVRTLVHSLDRSLPTYDEHPLTEIVAAATARARITLSLLALASALALLLGALGVYGVMAYTVSLRQREIGVRMALGAEPREVSGMISRQGLRLGLLGVGIGLAGALATTHLLRGLLYDVSPTDPLALGGTCLTLLAIAALASWIPARRAASIDPLEALRRD